ncbi:hypothetical protein CLOM_g21040 [Closterium sp. NIES-68]|nr:hypothetical protein CLOM_g21040 [Closterium sp. NIES-68]
MLTNAAVMDIICLFNSMPSPPEDLVSWRSHRDVEAFEREYLELEHEWETVKIERAGDLGVLILRHRPIVQVFTRMWTRMSAVDGFVTAPVHNLIDRVWRYYRAIDCTRFHDAHDAVKAKGAVAGCIVFSDVTHLSFNRRQLVHPMLLALVNTPEEARWLEGRAEMVAPLPPLPSDQTSEGKNTVFQEVERIVLGSLMALSTLDRCGTHLLATPSWIPPQPVCFTLVPRTPARLCVYSQT